MNKLLVLKYCLYALFGLVTSLVGLSFSSWGFWMLLAILACSDVVSEQLTLERVK